MVLETRQQPHTLLLLPWLRGIAPRVQACKPNLTSRDVSLRGNVEHWVCCCQITQQPHRAKQWKRRGCSDTTLIFGISALCALTLIMFLRPLGTQWRAWQVWQRVLGMLCWDSQQWWIHVGWWYPTPLKALLFSAPDTPHWEKFPEVWFGAPCAPCARPSVLVNTHPIMYLPE